MKRKSKNPLEVFHSATTSGNLVKSWRANFEIHQEDMEFACGISPEIILYPNGIDAEPEFKEVQKRASKLKDIAV